jgi:hypothetical protein
LKFTPQKTKFLLSQLNDCLLLFQLCEPKLLSLLGVCWVAHCDSFQIKVGISKKFHQSTRKWEMGKFHHENLLFQVWPWNRSFLAATFSPQALTLKKVLLKQVFCVYAKKTKKRDLTMTENHFTRRIKNTRKIIRRHCHVVSQTFK